MKLLLVEDDVMLAKGLARALQTDGFVVHQVSHGKQAISSVSTFAPEIAVLDLGLPDMDGVQVMKALREAQPNLPILILTARDTLFDKVDALDSGADDYLSKPFDMPELLARLRVLARRLGTSTSSEVSIAPITLDIASRKVRDEAKELSVTRREFMVLKALMENAGRVLTKDVIEDKLYGWGEEVASNTIEVHISNLRKKLPKKFIKTIRGVGYSIARSYESVDS